MKPSPTHNNPTSHPQMGDIQNTPHTQAGELRQANQSANPINAANSFSRDHNPENIIQKTTEGAQSKMYPEINLNTKRRKNTENNILTTWQESLREKLSFLKGKKSNQRKSNSHKRGMSSNTLMKPPSKKPEGKRWKENLKKTWSFLWKAAVILFMLGIIAVIGIFFYFSKDLPEPGQVNARFIAESTKIYDRTGETLLYDVHGEEKRTIIPMDAIPQTIIDATVALEDQNFYNHFGIHPQAIIRAALSQFGIGTRSGGSTITQQLVKNSILTNEHSLTRKIKEAILAVQIELKFSKEEILEMYLNEIPYGSNAYGVEAAAGTFFGKTARELTYDEAAILASLPQAPSRYSPFGNNRERLKGRQEHAIGQMAKLGMITETEADDFKSINVFSKLAKNREDIKAPHMVFHVLEELEEKYGPEFLEVGGLSVITTLDWEKQQIGQRIVKEQALKNETSFNAENAALVAIDPSNGDVTTMVGSRDYFDEKIDGQVNVATAERQPGSSFKPYAYLLGFVKGYTPETILYDVPTSFDISDQERDYEPQNYDGTFRGPVTIKESLGLSLNIPAVKALYLAGPIDTIEFAKDLGITSLNSPERYGLALVLGGGEVKLLDHVSAYSVFANNGIRHEQRSILEVKDNEGRIIDSAVTTTGKRIVEAEFVGMLSHSLSTNEYRVPAFGANNPLRYDDRPVAAKTGTTNENRDAWTVGYTPDVAIGVWAGNNDNRSMNSRGVGANAAAPIFRDFINEAYPTPSGKEFPEYNKEKSKTGKDILDGELDDGDEIDVCQISKSKQEYCTENKYCPDEKKKVRRFIDAHNILHYVIKDDPRGDEPDKPKDDPQYKNWDKGVEDYYEDQDDDIILGEEPDSCDEDDFDDFKPSIDIDVSVSDERVTIDVDDDSPFDIQKIEYKINGTVIASIKDDDYVYKASDDENNSTLEIEVVLTDVIGNTASASDEVDVEF